MKRLIVTVLVALVAAAGTLPAQAPVREEQFIYSVLSFNGKDYSGTFARERAEGVYLIAGVDNFIFARKTFVYFWPITAEWKTETSVFNETLPGIIELSGPGMEPRELSTVRFTYYNIKGEYELNWRVAMNEEADEIYQYYAAQRDAYWDERSAYSDASFEYQRKMDELTDRILAERRAGRDPADLVAELESLEPPEEPKAPDEFIVAPREPQSAYNINLPPGEYRIRFLTPDGKIMQGSEHKLVLFERRRSDTAGLEVIPADKWTRPEESRHPRSVLYVDGTTDVYLRPFYQDEYNDLYYEKLLRNDARGNPNIMKWVRLQQVPRATIALQRNGEIENVSEAPYRVEQVPGAALGYRILPYTPDPEQGEPDLFAFKVAIDRTTPVIRLEVRDSAGQTISGSRRQIRVVGRSGAPPTLLVLALLPLAVMGLVLAFRATKLS
jgi:hypothetical protein